MRIFKGDKKHGFKIIVLLCLMCLGVSGCADVEEKEDIMVIVDRNNEESPYTLTIAARNDVIKTSSIKCTYKQTNQEEVAFSVSGKKVETVYVKIGDPVKKGQLLAELEGSGNRDDEIEKLEYQIERNKLLLSYVDINENYALSNRWWTYIYKSSQTERDKESLDASLESIKQSYRYQKEDLEDAIALDTYKLNLILQQIEEGRIYAGMDGEISFVKAELEGWTTVENTAVIKIIDSSKCLFETNKTEYAKYFSRDQLIEMSVGYGKNAVSVYAVPYDMANWGTKMSFELLEDDTTPEVAVGSNGTITLVLEKKEQVLCVPIDAVNTAEGKTYVYVLGENNIREVKWIETGLYGDSLVEVVSGLTEGESIILR